MENLPDNVAILINNFSNFILKPITGLLFVLATAVFLWGVVEFIWKSDSDTDSRKTGQQHIMWGIIGMFIMVSVVAIINIFTGTFGIDPI